MLATDYPLLDLFWTMLFFFVFVIWIWTVVAIMMDIFRSPDLGGGSKALWFMFVLFLPIFGVLMYLVARGNKMHQHALDQAQAQNEAMTQYVRSVAPTSSPADELAKLADLHDQGLIDDSEYETQRAKVLA